MLLGEEGGTTHDGAAGAPATEVLAVPKGEEGDGLSAGSWRRMARVAVRRVATVDW